jgi:hypothetical protein
MLRGKAQQSPEIADAGPTNTSAADSAASSYHLWMVPEWPRARKLSCLQKARYQLAASSALA